MNQTELKLQIENIHTCFITQTITRIEATHTLEQLGLLRTKITRLLSVWDNERTIAAFTNITTRTD